MKRILFVCKHNLFRSRTALHFFNKLNKNKNYLADSAGIVKWNISLKNDKGYLAEKKVAKRYGVDLSLKSKGLSSSLLKRIDIVVIVADDVSSEIFATEECFSGKIIVWKTRDVKDYDKNKEVVAENSIKFIEKKVLEFVKGLK